MMIKSLGVFIMFGTPFVRSSSNRKKDAKLII